MDVMICFSIPGSDLNQWPTVIINPLSCYPKNSPGSAFSYDTTSFVNIEFLYKFLGLFKL